MRQKKFKPTAEDLFQFTASKSQEQQIKIIEAAITSFAVKGIEKTTYTYLADVCKISRPLIHHYFPSLDDLFLLTARYIRQTLLKLAIEGMNQAKSEDPLDQLLGYANGCLRWIKEYPHQCSFWFLYFYQASRSPQARKENTELVGAGHKRITEMLEYGNQMELWKIPDCTRQGKQIQVFITGVMISCMSEDGYLSLDVASQMFSQYFTKLKKP